MAISSHNKCKVELEVELRSARNACTLQLSSEKEKVKVD